MVLLLPLDVAQQYTLEEKLDRMSEREGVRKNIEMSYPLFV
jgi:hypothetical protein